MVHEPFLAFRAGSVKQAAVASVHRVMVTILLGAATRVWISIPAWADRLRPFMLGRQVAVGWLPVPSNVERVLSTSDIEPDFTPAVPNTSESVGHFGTFGSPISCMLEPLISPLLQHRPNRSLILMGQGSTEFRQRIVAQNPTLKAQIEATGEVAPAELSVCVRKCDLMIQPYPDGVSGRRTTAMLALSHGVPLITTAGSLTEDVWAQSGAAVLVPAADVTEFVEAGNNLLADEQKRSRMADRARTFYRDRFDLHHTIHALRSAREPQPAL
jgi:hypothetical protein